MQARGIHNGRTSSANLKTTQMQAAGIHVDALPPSPSPSRSPHYFQSPETARRRPFAPTPPDRPPRRRRCTATAGGGCLETRRPVSTGSRRAVRTAELRCGAVRCDVVRCGSVRFGLIRVILGGTDRFDWIPSIGVRNLLALVG